jgi:hypothetical protein
MKKGPEYEKHVLETYLLPLFPDAERRYHKKGPNNTDLGDFDNIGEWVGDAKKRETWALPAWIRNIRAKGKDTRKWFLIYAADGRRLPGDFVTVDARDFFDLLSQVEGAVLAEVREEGLDG